MCDQNMRGEICLELLVCIPLRLIVIYQIQLILNPCNIELSNHGNNSGRFLEGEKSAGPLFS
ncbi:MAG: hypothetical protein JAY99_08220 [Candidatus Thiodiazotropha lotti]|uniref:Uncharacterized protein n=1 Tax=Candidatus Thiodiazotropha endoloripes TaxID=1818881 RepID=A0A1E2USQ3_9GAMM|nr:hypothetical protein [Candidatus Thiodiazotropha endoloripes]MCG7898487.1 hypothetical protein [Candidatus Thiodiazotropha weberae]MCG7990639.1 hypothetical protein [Candidatus Thiodiazotropha lotti]MCG7904379.1 hypothetical protein [Candidatus Thiodiazotropha weberae]MCG7915677.1 hypothetical protein [Candidatus Thiodiazotropha weberae]MCG7999496.1 hypothetical protein [Candidatus Thiodiazotropha lotti]